MGYGEETLWPRTHLIRKRIWNVTNVTYNVASTIRVSSSGHWVTRWRYGPNFEGMLTTGSRTEDPSRAVQYEQARHRTERPISSARCITTTKDCAKYSEDNSMQKPLIQCEYAHAMGNSQGGFKDILGFDP